MLVWRFSLVATWDARGADRLEEVDAGVRALVNLTIEGMIGASLGFSDLASAERF